MKRLGLTLITAVCLTATTFAAGNQPTTAKWDGNINVTKLSKYLKLSAGQHEEVADRKSTRLNSSHRSQSRMPSSA